MTRAPGRAVAVLLAACGVLGVALGGLVVAAAPARAVTVPSLRIDLGSVSAASISPGSTLVVSGALHNAGSSPITGLQVRLRLAWQQLDRAGLNTWAARSASEYAGSEWVAQRIAGRLAPGADATFTLSGVADALGLPRTAAGFGPRGLAIEVVGDTGRGEQQLALQRTFVVWDPTAGTAITRLAVLAPLTASAPATSTDAGQPTAGLLADWGPDGRLSRVVGATRSPVVSWAIDPALFAAAATAQQPPAAPGVSPGTASASSPSASIAGSAGTSPGGSPGAQSAAAATAAAWTREVVAGAAGRSTYALPWGDPDLAALAHAGARGLLNTAEVDASAATRAALGRTLDTTLALPLDGLADAATVALLGRAAGRTVVLSDVIVPGPRDGSVAPAHVHLPGVRPDVTGLVADRALSASVAAMGGATAALATQRVLAELASVSAPRDPGTQSPAGGSASTGQPSPGQPSPGQPSTGQPSAARDVLAALPRDWNPDPASMRAGLALLQSARWVSLEPVSAARARTATPAAKALRAYPAAARQAELPTEHVAAVYDAFRRLAAFAPALTEPDLIVPAAHRQALSVVGLGWRRPSSPPAARGAALAQARRALVATVDTLYDSVAVLTSSSTNLLARSGQVPITVTSRLPQAVNLVLTLQPRSGRLLIDGSQRVALEAATNGTARSTVFVRFTAVANGDVAVEATLSAPGSSVPLVRAPSPIAVHIHQDWEDRGLVVAGLVLLALLVLGLVRSVRSGRHRLPPTAAPDPDDIGAVPTALPRPLAEPVVLPTPLPVPAQAPGAANGFADLFASVSSVAAEPGRPLPGRERRTPRAAVPPAASHATSQRAPDEPSDARPVEPVSLAGSSALMTAGTFVSRVLGMVRAVVLSAAIGAFASGDAFNTANTLPNNMFILIGGGVLNAVLVPQIVRAARQPDGGKDYVDRLVTLAVVVLGGSTVVLTACAPLLVRLYAGGWSAVQLQLGTSFALWCLPQIFFYGLYTIYGQVLNARGSFGPYMWAPVVNNVVAIGGMIAFIVISGGGERPAADWTAGDIALLAGTTTLGVVAQALVLVPVLRKAGYVWRPRWGWRGVGLRSAGTVALWSFAGVAVSQLAFVVISNVVNTAGRVAAGGPHPTPGGRSVYDYAYLLFMLPHSLVAVSLVTAVFTRMSAAAGEGRAAQVRDDLSFTVRTVGVATVLSTVAFVVLGSDLTFALFVRTPRETTDQYALVATALLLGLVPFSAQYLFQRVFYAYQDARTPFWIGVLMTGLWTTGTLLAAWLLPAGHVAVGVALALSASSAVGAAVTVAPLRARLGDLDGARIVRTHARLLAAAVGAGALAWSVRSGAHAVLGDGRAASYVVLALAGGVMLAAYALLLRALRVPELDDLLRPLLARARGERSSSGH